MISAPLEESLFGRRFLLGRFDVVELEVAGGGLSAGKHVSYQSNSIYIHKINIKCVESANRDDTCS